MFINVVVNVPIKDSDKGFTYSIPEELIDFIMPGIRVTVPFGAQQVEGFITNKTNELPSDLPKNRIKPITNVIDKTPVLSDEFIKLGSWMADRYFARLASIYQTMLPAGIKTDVDKRIIAKITVEQLEDISLNNEQHELLSYITFEKSVKDTQLAEKFPDSSQIIKELSKLGYIEVIVGHKVHSKPKFVSYVLWKHSTDFDVIKNELSRAKKQIQIAKYLINNGYTKESEKGVAVNELLHQLKTTKQTLQAMCNKGLIDIFDVEIKRTPNEIDNSDFERPILTINQQQVYEQILDSMIKQKNDTFLLHGVTGSGKTEVYLKVIDKVIELGKQAIVLVPEISLTPQMVERFKNWFGCHVAVMHSRLSNGERFDEWHRMKTGEAKVVVGARSAIFAPFADVGVIVIDEEHETSYKQDEHPKYDAREVAIFRAKWHNCPVILGSATPSVESYYLAKHNKYKLLRMANRINNQIMPEMKIIDMRDELKVNNHHVFSNDLKNAIQENLDKKLQTILFINRRGHSNFVICRECGQVSYCSYCNITMTYHKQKNNLQCHYCSFQIDNFKTCQKCKNDSVELYGMGTEKIEYELKELFPSAKILRMDIDTTRKKGDHQRIINQFQKGKADILIGTQMIAKGLDFPNVTLVGVISADTSLHLPDFRASERTFQLITQVGGRAGRHSIAGKVIVQTFNPTHYGITHAVNYEYEGFYQDEIAVRQQMGYPPFSRLIFIVFSHTKEQVVRNFSLRFAARLQEINKQNNNPLFLLGPTPAVLSRIKNRFRYSLIIKYAKWQITNHAILQTIDMMQEECNKSNIIMNIDVNPQLLL